MDNLSKVIFTCIAISITLLVYQNTQLKDDVDTLKNRIEALENPYEVEIFGIEGLVKCDKGFRKITDNAYMLNNDSNNLLTFDEAKEFCKNRATEK